MFSKNTQERHYKLCAAPVCLTFILSHENKHQSMKSVRVQEQRGLRLMCNPWTKRWCVFLSFEEKSML